MQDNGQSDTVGVKSDLCEKRGRFPPCSRALWLIRCRVSSFPFHMGHGVFLAPLASVLTVKLKLQPPFLVTEDESFHLL